MKVRNLEGLAVRASERPKRRFQVDLGASEGRLVRDQAMLHLRRSHGWSNSLIALAFEMTPQHAARRLSMASRLAEDIAHAG